MRFSWISDEKEEERDDAVLLMIKHHTKNVGCTMICHIYSEEGFPCVYRIGFSGNKILLFAGAIYSGEQRVMFGGIVAYFCISTTPHAFSG